MTNFLDVPYPLRRRDALRLGVAAAGTAAFGIPAVTGALPSAAAALSATTRFDLAQPSTRYLGPCTLHEKYKVMQSFCFNKELQRIYVFQLRTGTSLGDACISELDMSGRVTGYMHLDNVGHGISIGCETIDGKPYLWTEADGVRRGDSVWGSALARFPFVSGTRPVMQKFLTGSDRITCATDPYYKRIAVRRRGDDSRPWVTVYDMADATRGDFSKPLVHVRCRGVSGTTFQGYALHGSQFYTLDGDYHAPPTWDSINSYLTVFDVNTGKRLDRSITRAGYALAYREPEGMAVITPPGGSPRLCFGIASRVTPNAPEDFLNLYYKDALMRPAPGSSSWSP